MPLINLSCPKCGAQLQADANQSKAVCLYCNNAFLIDRNVTNYNITVNQTIMPNSGSNGYAQNDNESLASACFNFLKTQRWFDAQKYAKMLMSKYPGDFRGFYYYSLSVTRNLTQFVGEGELTNFANNINKAAAMDQGFARDRSFFDCQQFIARNKEYLKKRRTRNIILGITIPVSVLLFIFIIIIISSAVSDAKHKKETVAVAGELGIYLENICDAVGNMYDTVDMSLYLSGDCNSESEDKYENVFKDIINDDNIDLISQKWDYFAIWLISSDGKVMYPVDNYDLLTYSEHYSTDDVWNKISENAAPGIPDYFTSDDFLYVYCAGESNEYYVLAMMKLRDLQRNYNGLFDLTDVAVEPITIDYSQYGFVYESDIYDDGEADELMVPLEMAKYAPLSCFEYTLADGCITLNKYKASGIDTIIIPPVYLVDGCEYSVTALDSTFSFGVLDAVVIPDGVTTIDYVCFSCSSVKELYIPATVTDVEDDFWYFTNSIDILYYGGTEEQLKELSIDFETYAETIYYEVPYDKMDKVGDKLVYIQ